MRTDGVVVTAPTLDEVRYASDSDQIADTPRMTRSAISGHLL